MRTTKISISIDKRVLEEAKKAAAAEGLSLSSFVGQTLYKRLDDKRQARARLRAARALWKEWGVTEPTSDEKARFVENLSRPRRRRRKAA